MKIELLFFFFDKQTEVVKMKWEGKSLEAKLKKVQEKIS